MEASFRSLFAFRCLCLRTPAASSMRARRSSGFDCRMESREPWEIIECVPVPSPESCKDVEHVHAPRHRAVDEVFALARTIHAARDGNLVEVDRQLAVGVVEHQLDLGKARGLRADEPAKMTSSIADHAKCLALRLPSTHSTASEILDLPEPFGPTTAVMPGSRKARFCRRTT